MPQLKMENRKSFQLGAFTVHTLENTLWKGGKGVEYTKPIYNTERSGLFALGYVSNLQPALNVLSKRIESIISKEELDKELDNNIKDSYDNDRIVYFEYDSSGNPYCATTFSDRCAIFAVDTGFRDRESSDTIYAQFNKTQIGKGWRGIFFYTKTQILSNMQPYRIGALSFRDYPSANSFIIDLEKLLLPGEVWKYAKASDGIPRPKTTFQILESYLGVISSVLVRECMNPDAINYGKIRFSSGNTYAAFNTGLLSNKVIPVFVVGEVYPKNWNGFGSFQISNPKILKGGRTELKAYGFPGDVLSTDMVNFFSDLSHIVYDATIPIDVDDIEKLEHCIDDGIARNRFPAHYKNLWESGQTDDVIDKFRQAIARAEQIARRNYKYVVPQYRPSKENDGNIQFLMPIYFSSNYSASPDFALVLSKDYIGDEAFYRPETVLELSWAYNNARVLCKPDNTWLKPEEIEEADEEDYDA